MVCNIHLPLHKGPIMKYIHTGSEQAAHVVPLFPFTYGVNCTVRVWVETKPTYGQRLMTQYFDHAKAQWSKPKCKDGYYPLVFLQVNEPGESHYEPEFFRATSFLRLCDITLDKAYELLPHADDYQQAILLSLINKLTNAVNEASQ